MPLDAPSKDLMTAENPLTLSVVLPAKNEETNLDKLLRDLKSRFKNRIELLVVNDGSTDRTALITRDQGASLISHPYSMGNGAAIKSGARVAKGDILVFMDADGQHDPADIQRLLDKLDEGYDMAVGARSAGSQASVGRWFGNTLYNHLASWMVGHRIMDLTSGFRAVRADKFKQFLYLLPNGFSYPTTITMAFFRAGYPVAYVPIEAKQRSGRSHIRPLRDSIRFFLIIFRVGTLYSPLKLFFPVSLFHFLLGLSYYGYTYYFYSRFTNMSALLFTTAIVIFLIGLVSEQITNLLYSGKR